MKTPLCNRPSGIYILNGFSEKNVTGSANFPPGCPVLSGPCFAFLKRTRMIHDGHVKAAPRMRQTGRVKLKISPGTGEAKSSLVEGKKSTVSSFTGSLLQRYIKSFTLC